MTHASLPMYDWPECRAETDATWAAIRDGARARLPGIDLPEVLTAPDWAAIEASWRDPGLVFSQTCWGPLSLGLIAVLEPLAQPDYSGFEGGRGPVYRSALIARAGAACAVPETPGAALPEGLLSGQRFAMNGPESLSGYLALRDDLGTDPCALATDTVHTGVHRGSVRAVADGRADIAAIDCRSWALARRFEPCAEGLVVVGWTAERRGLPYVTSRATEAGVKAALRDTLMQLGCFAAPEGGQR